MNNDAFIINYPTFNGEVKIRTITSENEILISLHDVMTALSAENKKLSEPNKPEGLMGMIRGILESLDNDEYQYLPFRDEKSSDEQQEIFITEPGLYRVVSQDPSPSCKKFQRWVFHDVLPSIRKYGIYPPPNLLEKTSEIKALAQQLAQNTNILLKEIEEREKLAKETKRKFEITEKQLKEINLKLCDLSNSRPPSSYISIKEYCLKNNIVDIDEQYIWGMCTKISIEKNIKSEVTTQSIQKPL
jgi:prophage antirepressor-like protein